MDFDKTSFSVDWYSPADKYAPKRLSFPKSARISIDDLVPDSPLSFCFSPFDGAFLSPQPRSYSFVDAPPEATARGWPNSAPPSPLVLPEHCEQYAMYDQDLAKQSSEEDDSEDWRALATPGLLSLADDFALCGVDLDVSCLDALDEQLLASPVECFSELCWATAVRDDVATAAPVKFKNTRSRVRSFKHDYEQPSMVPPPAFPREYPGSFERSRPLAARIMLPLDRYPSTHSCESHDGTAIYPTRTKTKHDKKPFGYFSEADLVKGVHPTSSPLPVQGIPVVSRRTKKRDQHQHGGGLNPTRSREVRTLSQPSTPASPNSAGAPATKTSHTFRVISEAYSTFTRSRRKFPH